MKQNLEEARSLRLTNEKLDAHVRVSLEQMENAKKALEDLSIKKQQELELINKEISSLAVKERDSK